ncbi:hypothetical protein A1351_20695 [Methylosinus sp. R-45379]|nr:hypothetical protein A1351_20695 [Methylosinus sp. R-45379]
MIRGYAIVREAASRIGEAVERVTGALVEGRVEQEPAFTDRMLGSIEHVMNGFESRGVQWQAKTFTDRGPGAQESRVGADFAGVFTAKLPDFEVNKGFLAQAKLINPGERMSKKESKRLRDQCDKMLSISPASFVFLYTPYGVSVVPAISIHGSQSREPHEFYQRSVTRFFEEHFESFIGDRRLHAATPAGLATVMPDAAPRRILSLLVEAQ